MTSPLDPAALELYEAPFRFSPSDIAIIDKNGSHVLTCGHSHIGNFIAAALTEYWERNKS